MAVAARAAPDFPNRNRQRQRQRQRHRSEDKNLENVKDRLDTFRHWPSFALPITQDLADEGFYYTGIRDQVRCYACKILLESWKRPYEKFKRHGRESPDCPVANACRSPDLRESPPEAPEDMTSTVQRLGTYSGWPASHIVSPENLAEAGFYYKGKGDAVECCVCHVVLRFWERGDTAEGEHRRHSPHCPVVSGNTQPAPSKVPTPPPPSYLANKKRRLETFRTWPRTAPVCSEDLAEAGFFYTGRSDVVRCFTCGTSINQWLPGDVPIDEHARHSPNCAYVQSKRVAEPIRCPDPTDAQMNEYYQRLATYERWPSSAVASPDRLADAGFYYTGSVDKVMCFSCGGRLRGWEPNDDPWTEHRKHFPNCRFVKEHFGIEEEEQGYDEPWHQPVQRSQFVSKAIEMGYPTDKVLRVVTGFDAAGTFNSFLEVLAREPDSVAVPSAPPPPSDVQLCKVCMEREMNTLFLPCAHIACCVSCADDLHECPICRTEIQSRIRTFFS